MTTKNGTRGEVNRRGRGFGSPHATSTNDVCTGNVESQGRGGLQDLVDGEGPASVGRRMVGRVAEAGAQPLFRLVVAGSVGGKDVGSN